MTGHTWMYAAILAILVGLFLAYCITFYQLYKFYRKYGLTRKQAALTMWRMKNE